MQLSKLQTPTGGRWPRQLSKEVESGILDAAFEVFHEKGFNGATTDQIAKRAGISKPALYRRYSNKTEILEAVVYQSLDVARSAFEGAELDPAQPEQSLREYGLRIRALNRDVRYVETNRLMLAEAGRQPELVQIWRKSMLDEILTRLVDFFEVLIAEGRMCHDYPELAARNFLVTFAGSFRPLYGVKESKAEATKVFDSDLKTFIRGCAITGV